MHILESYALQNDLKIDKPHLYEKFFPLAVEKLAGCVFVQNVEFRALAVILPILERGLKDKITEIRRKSCVIIDNMCKLIEDPKEIPSTYDKSNTFLIFISVHFTILSFCSVFNIIF